jgi:Ca2+-binding RTX toxin-like protein
MMNTNLQQALRSATTALSNFAHQPNFWQNFELAFGQDFDRIKATEIQQAAITQNFMLPVEVLTDSAMGIATGAYAAATDTIYLRESFVEAGDISAISAVIVEELGHAIDSRVNKVETPGDEGAIFRLLVEGVKIAQDVLAELRAEDDWSTILVASKQLAVEMAVINGTPGDDILFGDEGNDQINGLGGNDTLYAIGVDTLEGGDGIDKAIVGVYPSTSAFTATLNADGSGSISDGTIFKGIEKLSLNGSNGADYVNVATTTYPQDLSGKGGRDTLIGGNGDDFLSATRGSTVDGGGGTDSLTLHATVYSPNPLVGSAFNLIFDANGNGTSSDGTSIKNIESFYFSGASESEYINAGATNYSNQLNGAGGKDTLISGAGDDYLLADIGSTIDGGAGKDSLTISIPYKLNGNTLGANLTFDANGNSNSTDGSSIKNIESFTFFGGSGNDYINASATTYSNTFFGSGGEDTLIGGSGNDAYYISTYQNNASDINIIDDRGGTDDKLILNNYLLFHKSGTTLGVDSNKDQQDDLLILNFFGANGGAGTGAIESIKNRSLGSIFNQFAPVKTDIGGDRRSDIIWRQGDGSVRLWQMDGANTASNSLLASPVDASWKITDTGDFNGDSKADIIWSNTDGRISLWQMDGSTILATDVLSPETGWKVSGTGSFSLNDSKTDILWRNIDGNVAIWQMDGSNVLSSKVLGKVDNTWKFASTGDFNGDKNSDVIWRNDNGDVAIWLMDGDAVSSSVVRGNVTTDWKIAGVNDFNDDGKADILWQNTDGRIALWQMNGTDVVFADVIGNAAGFTVVGTGDYNGDAYGDLLLRNAQGANEIWNTNGQRITAQNTIASTDPSWKAMPAGLDVSVPPILLT